MTCIEISNKKRSDIGTFRTFFGPCVRKITPITVGSGRKDVQEEYFRSAVLGQFGEDFTLKKKSSVNRDFVGGEQWRDSVCEQEYVIKGGLSDVL